MYFDKIGPWTIQDSNIFNTITLDTNNAGGLTFVAGTTTAFNTLAISGKPGIDHAISSSSAVPFYLRPLNGWFSIDYVTITDVIVI